VVIPAGGEALAVRPLEWKTFAAAVDAVLATSGKTAAAHR
jgi:hypothetical protein